MRIIIFWDSIAEWFWDYENWWWVNRLKIDYWKQYWYEKIIFNAWVSAYTSNNIINCFDNTVKAISRREEWKEKDTIIIFAIWINDSAENIITKEKRVELHQFKKNIEALIEKCKQEKLIQRVIFLSAINVEEQVINDVDSLWAEHFFYNNEIKEYNSVVQQLAGKEWYEYIDVFWTMQHNDLEDGLHPSSKWHQKIYEIVLKYLEN